MKLKKWLALLLAAAALASLAACRQEEPEQSSSSAVVSEPEPDPNYPVALGDEIHIPARPETVVSLSPALTEILYELGAGDRLEGVSDYCDYPPAAEGLARCGTAQTPDLDSLEALSPDVVFASAPLSQQDTVSIQQMGAQVVVLRRAQSLEELEELYISAATVLDGLLDGEKNGVDTFAALKNGYDALRRAADGLAEQYSGIYLRGRPLMMATGDTFEGELLELIGIQNDAAEFTDWAYPQEQAAQLYPDVIFYDGSVGLDYLKSTQIYNTTDAVKQGRCYEFDAAAFERQSARMLGELTQMFQAAYPDAGLELDAPAGEEPDGEESQAASEEDDEVLELDDATQIH